MENGPIDVSCASDRAIGKHRIKKLKLCHSDRSLNVEDDAVISFGREVMSRLLSLNSVQRNEAMISMREILNRYVSPHAENEVTRESSNKSLTSEHENSSVGLLTNENGIEGDEESSLIDIADIKSEICVSEEEVPWILPNVTETDNAETFTQFMNSYFEENEHWVQEKSLPNDTCVEEEMESESNEDGASPPPCDLDPEIENRCLVLLVSRRLRGLPVIPKCKKQWVIPENAGRVSDHHFEKFFTKLRRNREKFVDFFHIFPETFDTLLHIIAPYIKKSDTNMRIAISAEERLAVTLRYLATGISARYLGQEFRLGKSTISVITRYVFEVICKVLRKTYMPEPTRSDWIATSKKFSKEFMNCAGVLTAKKIKLNCSKQDAVKTLVLIALVDADNRFIYADVEDLSFDNLCSCPVFNEWLKTTGTTLQQSCKKSLPLMFVGNGGIFLNRFILVPYRKPTNEKEVLFNSKINFVCQHAEDTLNLLCDRWRFLTGSLLKNPATIKKAIEASCILHNFAYALEGGHWFCENETFKLDNFTQRGGSNNKAGKNFRSLFADNFFEAFANQS